MTTPEPTAEEIEAAIAASRPEWRTDDNAEVYRQKAAAALRAAYALAAPRLVREALAAKPSGPWFVCGITVPELCDPQAIWFDACLPNDHRNSMHRFPTEPEARAVANALNLTAGGGK